MGRDRDENTGKFTETTSDDEILEYIYENDGVGTTDVADEFGYEQPSAYRRLKELEKGDRVNSRKIGRSILWTVNE